MKKIFLLILVLLISLIGKTQSYQITKFDVKDGLMTNSIGDFIQSKNGCLWISNGGGLTKYDGKRFTNYKGTGLIESDLVEDSIGYIHGSYSWNNFNNGNAGYFNLEKFVVSNVKKIQSVFIKDGKVGGSYIGPSDGFGNLWIIDELNKAISKFNGINSIKMTIKDGLCSDSSLLFNHSSIMDNIIDNKGMLWVKSTKGMYRYNGNKFINYPNMTITPLGIFEDSKNRIWTKSKFNSSVLYCYNKTKLDSFNLSSYGVKKISLTMIEDKSGKLYINSQEGLITFNDKKITIDTNVKDIAAIYIDKKGRLVFRKNEDESHSTIWYYNEKDELKVILGMNSMGKVIIDYENNIWVGTNEGLLKCVETNFDVIPFQGKEYFEKSKDTYYDFLFCSSKNEIYYFAKTGNKSIHKGVGIFLLKEGEFIPIIEDENLYPESVIVDKNGKIWIYTRNQRKRGFYKLYVIEDSKAKEINSKVLIDSKDKIGLWAKLFVRPDGNISILSSKLGVFNFINNEFVLTSFSKEPKKNTFYTLSKTKKDVFYCESSSKNSFIYSYDFKKDNFIALSKDSTDRINQTSDFLKDNSNNYWFFNVNNGLIKLSSDKKYIVQKYDSLIHKAQFNKNIILKTNGEIWFSTSFGIAQLKTNNDTNTNILNIGIKQGLSSNEISDFLIDKNNTLWAVTPFGIDYFNIDSLNLGHQDIKHLSFKDDLFNDTRNELTGDLFEDSEGNIYAPTEILFYKINTKSKIKNNLEPITNITQFTTEYFNSNGEVIQNSYSKLPNEVMNLNYKSNTVSFEVIGVSLTKPERVLYKIMLDGYDKVWGNPSTSTYYKYTNLKEGNYTFKVIACNNDGVWNKEPVTFSFTIQAPWYRTNLAYCGYVLCFLSIVFGFNKVRTRQLKIRQLELEQTVEERTNEVVHQKEKVEEKQKEILDSIEYALRIQTAILPPQKIVKQYLENSFILYKPKDIVAGDFYWMETVNDLVLFAACDCTGHGVPGAMVSVVCHNALNRAVREFGLTQPAAILDKTAEIVIENFSKSEEDIKDGMDISLCAYNTKTKTIQWAGANNPLWLLQNGELIETKADKQPIGMNENSKPFTNHTFKLNTTDTIYLFTDGFADQFGGDTGQKKLTKKRFKDLILSVQNKTLQEQGIALDKFITDYRKEVEQIDDILVMGVKV